MNNVKLNRESYYPWLDSVRFIAAFMVLLSHSRNDFFLPYNELPNEQQSILSFLFYFCCRLGHEAVIVFFVISGFLVGGRGLEKLKSGTFDNRDYMIDRTVRIALPLIATIIFCIFTYYIIGQNFNYLDALGNLLSLQGVCCAPFISPLWSLSYEVWFYIILLGISLASTKKIKGLILLAICMLVFTKLDSRYVLIWFLGAFAFLCKPKKRSVIVLFVSFIALLISLALSIMSSNSNAIILLWKPDYFLMEAFLSICVCIFIQQVILFKTVNKHLVRIDCFFSNLAKFSYTLYLTHRVTLLLIFQFLFSKGAAQFNADGLLTYALILLLCIIVSWLIYLVSEKHTKKVKTFVKGYFITK